MQHFRRGNDEAGDHAWRGWLVFMFATLQPKQHKELDNSISNDNFDLPRSFRAIAWRLASTIAARRTKHSEPQTANRKLRASKHHNVVPPNQQPSKHCAEFYKTAPTCTLSSFSLLQLSYYPIYCNAICLYQKLMKGPVTSPCATCTALGQPSRSGELIAHDECAG